MPRRQSTIMGVSIDDVTKAEALERIETFLQFGQHHIVTPNAEFLLQARRKQKFSEVLNDADLAVLDGSGPKIASWFTAVRLREIVPGSDLVKEILGVAGERQKKVMVLNLASSLSSTDEIKKAVENRYAGVEIKVLSLVPKEIDSATVLQSINDFNPTILFVGFGSPSQDLWIAENLKKLPGVRLAMGIGGSFDFISGKRQRAPLGFRKLGLEWLYRLFSKPKGGKYYFGRRAKKIFRSVIVFPIIFVFTFNKG